MNFNQESSFLTRFQKFQTWCWRFQTWWKKIQTWWKKFKHVAAPCLNACVENTCHWPPARCAQCTKEGENWSRICSCDIASSWYHYHQTCWLELVMSQVMNSTSFVAFWDAIESACFGFGEYSLFCAWSKNVHFSVAHSFNTSGVNFSLQQRRSKYAKCAF